MNPTPKSRSRTPVVIDAETGPAPRDRATPVEKIDARRPGSFFTFHYSCTEVSLSGGRARIRSSRTALENGRLTSESFEGEADRSTYERVVDDAQREFIARTSALLGSFAFFLPFGPRRSGRD